MPNFNNQTNSVLDPVTDVLLLVETELDSEPLTDLNGSQGLTVSLLLQMMATVPTVTDKHYYASVCCDL